MEASRSQRRFGAVLVLALLVVLSSCRGGTTPATPQVLVTATPEGIEATPTLRPVVPTRPPAAPAQTFPSATIIVDNTDPGFAIEAGDWGTCNNGDCGGICFGDDFRFADPSCPSCQARFTFEVAAAGEYDVWTWWPYGDDRATDTRFTIIYSGGPYEAEVNQRNAGDAWYWLASLTFTAGESASILVEGTATGYANADAIALTPVGSGPPGEEGTEPSVAEAEIPTIQYFYSEQAPTAGCYYLHWDVSQAVDVYLNDEAVENPGSTEVCPEETTDYWLRAENEAGSAEQVLTLGVEEAVAPESPTAVPSPQQVAEPTSVPSPGQAAAPPAGGFRRIIFLHHSCGANFIEQGGVRARFTALGYEFYDHGYNGDGLVLADGTWTGQNFNVPDDNTDPDGYAAIFSQPLHSPPDNTFSHLMQYDVIAFKSCFPVSNIDSEEQLAEYKSYYLSIRQRLAQYPNKIFVIVTQPPEIPADTDRQAAARARAFTNWLASGEYLNDHTNVFTFNFFDLLADPATNMLRTEYQTDPSDAHPNERANRAIAPLFVEFVDQAVRRYTAQ